MTSYSWAVSSVLYLDNITRDYGIHGDAPALNGVSLEVSAGEFVAIEGPSGAGKSTLLNILGLLDEPTSGRYVVGEIDVAELSPRAAATLRSDRIGLVFQSFHLLDARPVIDSVELGLLYRGVPAADRRQRALHALGEVRIAHLAFKPARLLSGGERQRVAVARALASGAPVLLADEPTGNLDSENTRVLLETLVRLHAAGTTIVLVTHSEDVARYAQRRVVLVDGQVRSDSSLDTHRAELGVQADETAQGEVSPGGREEPPGRGSRLRAVDAIKDAWDGVNAMRTRALGVAAAVAVGVGLAVATLGVSFSAAAQVSDAFDARANRDVSVSWVASESSPELDVADEAASRLNGVDAVTVVEDLGEVGIAASVQRPETATRLVVLTGAPDALRVRLSGSHDQMTALNEGEALVGATLAESLHLGPQVANPVVYVNGEPLRVVGTVDSSPRKPELLSAIVVPEWQDHTAERTVTLYAYTSLGAAQQVAGEVAVAIDPYQPESLVVTAPPDPADLRAEIEGQVSAMLAIVTTVAIVGGFVSLVSAMLLSVGQRTREIGLRRAVGARSEHIAALVTIEASLVGFLGGVAGLVLGLGAVLLTSVANGWIPVFAIWMGPVAVLVGVVMGVTSGLVASRRAVRIEPQAALRGA